jgi:hypothetical protein
VFFTLFIILVVIIGIWAALIFTRKSMWDAVHRNLLDLEDLYGGKVIRQGFASRPIYQGTYKNIGLTINFSTEKIKGGRMTYIDISYAKSCNVSLTISAKKWLEQRNSEELDDFIEINNRNNTPFILRPKSENRISRLIKHSSFIDCLDELENLAYLFVGKTGIICEFHSNQIVQDTTIKIFNKRLATMNRVIGLISPGGS